MKKKITVCAVLLAVAVFFANAYLYEEGYYYNAEYIGTTEDWTLEECYNKSWRKSLNNGLFISPVNKLTEQKNRFMWNAINEYYDYAPGEIYEVFIVDGYGNFTNLFVQITKKGSGKWLGFSGVIR